LPEYWGSLSLPAPPPRIDAHGTEYRLTFDLEFLYVYCVDLWVMILARLGLNVKDKSWGLGLSVN